VFGVFCNLFFHSPPNCRFGTYHYPRGHDRWGSGCYAIDRSSSLSLSIFI